MNRRVRREIRYAVSDVTVPLMERDEFKHLVDTKQSPAIRIFYLLAIISCVSICCYQLQERVNWYFTYPVSVKVGLFERNVLEKIELQFCSYIESDVIAAGKESQKKQMQHDKLKHGRIILNVTNTNINGSEFIAENIEISYKFSTFGYCGSTKISYPDGGENTYSNNIFVNATPDINIKLYDRNGWAYQRRIFDKSVLEWLLHIRQYRLFSTPRKPCLTQRQYLECLEKCFISDLTTNSKCRFNTNPNAVNLPPCDCKINTSLCSEYYTRQYTFDIEDCNCTTPCSRFKFIVTNERDPDITHEPILLRVIVNDVVMTMNEERIYSAINLSIDFGGSIGLFLGLALLEIVNNFVVLFNLITRKVKSYKRRHNYIHKLVKKTFKNHCQAMQNQTQPIFNNISDGLFTRLKTAAWLACAGIAIFMIQSQVGYYISQPVRTIVELGIRQFTSFPPITICGPSRDIINLTKVVAAQKNITDWNQVDTLDLLDGIQNLTISDIWTKSLPNIYLKECSIIRNVTVISTHEGKCYHFAFEKLQLLLVCMFGFKVPIVDKFHSKSLYKIYTGDFDSDSYNIITQITAEAITFVILDYYNFQKIIYVNRRVNPCVDSNKFKQCTQRCFENLYQNENICQLPLRGKLGTNKPCTMSLEAKVSREKTMKVIARVALGRSCKCVRPCEENIALKTFTKEAMNHFTVELEMSSKVIENIVEVNVYSLVALCCDIGNILGTALGVSMLDILSYSRYTIRFFNVVLLKNKGTTK